MRKQIEHVTVQRASRQRQVRHLIINSLEGRSWNRHGTRSAELHLSAILCGIGTCDHNVRQKIVARKSQP
jgi:hypothetical protein